MPAIPIAETEYALSETVANHGHVSGRGPLAGGMSEAKFRQRISAKQGQQAWESHKQIQHYAYSHQER